MEQTEVPHSFPFFLIYSPGVKIWLFHLKKKFFFTGNEDKFLRRKSVFFIAYSIQDCEAAGGYDGSNRSRARVQPGEVTGLLRG